MQFGLHTNTELACKVARFPTRMEAVASHWGHRVGRGGRLSRRLKTGPTTPVCEHLCSLQLVTGGRAQRAGVQEGRTARNGLAHEDWAAASLEVVVQYSISNDHGRWRSAADGRCLPLPSGYPY